MNQHTIESMSQSRRQSIKKPIGATTKKSMDRRTNRYAITPTRKSPDTHRPIVQFANPAVRESIYPSTAEAISISIDQTIRQ